MISASAKAADDHALFPPCAKVSCAFLNHPEMPQRHGSYNLQLQISRRCFFVFSSYAQDITAPIHCSCNIREFLFHSVFLQISIYAATFISSYFCPLNVSFHSTDWPL